MIMRLVCVGLLMVSLPALAQNALTGAKRQRWYVLATNRCLGSNSPDNWMKGGGWTKVSPPRGVDAWLQSGDLARQFFETKEKCEDYKKKTVR